MATITVMFGPDNVGAHRMAHSPFTVGRDPSCGVTIDNAGISRTHCRFLYDGKHFFVEDMESANGTFHHGHKIRKASVADGDKIRIGKFTLIFSHSKDEAPPTVEGEAGDGPARESEKALGSDPMLTFKMDGRDLQAQMQEMESRAAAGPQRASDVARAFKPAATSSGVRPARGGASTSRAFKLFLTLALMAVLALAAVTALRSLGIIS